MNSLNRRQFLQTSGSAAAGLGVSSVMAADKKPLFQVSLAQWTLVQSIRSGDIDNLDFAKVAAEHKIFGLEYVNQFFMDKAKDEAYLGEMKKRASDAGVQSLIIMCDREGNIGAPDEKQRKQTVENHRKWVDAAKFLGCHSIRVNAASSGTYDEQVKLAADGLRQLTEVGAAVDIDVIVENHGGLSSHGGWLAEVIKTVDHKSCGTLPDFGNFRINDGESYDSYQGIKDLMSFARGVSVKNRGWDSEGNSIDIDFEKMLKIVLESGFRGWCGIEYGGFAGLNQSREALETVRDKLADQFD
ncbi:MAG: TIM barrel protein [Verrucomicrobiota bacterium]